MGLAHGKDAVDAMERGSNNAVVSGAVAGGERHWPPEFCVRRGCAACLPAPAAGDPPGKVPRSVGVASVGTEGDARRTIERVVSASNVFRSCGFFATAAEALKAIPGLRLEIVFVAPALPDLCGIELLRRLWSCRPGVRGVLVLPAPDAVLLGRAIRAGVEHFLMRPFEPRRCIEVLWMTAWRPAGPTARAGPGRLAPGGSVGPAPCLAEREGQVLALVAGGLEYKHIEDCLGISHSAMRRLQRSVFRKLHAPNATAAIANWLGLQSLVAGPPLPRSRKA